MTQTPAVQTPVPLLQGVWSSTFVCAQPVVALQVSVVHSLLSSHAVAEGVMHVVEELHSLWAVK